MAIAGKIAPKSKFEEYKRSVLEKEAAEHEAEKKAEEDRLAASASVPIDRDAYAHCWVLVKSGQRGVEADFYIEPSTGVVYNTADAPYGCVESMWNEANVWVNMQEVDAEISLDLDDTGLWEHVFLSEVLKPPEVFGADSDAESIASMPAEVPENDEAKQGEVLDLPISWVSPLDVSRLDYRKRYSKSAQRAELYHKAKFESFAIHENPHGMIHRVTLYSDVSEEHAVKIREYFSNRRDKLKRRVRFPLDRRIEEIFAEGRASGLMRLVEVSGTRREIYFYPGVRLDGLLHRIEDIGNKIEDTFQGREDKMVLRTVVGKMSPANKFIKHVLSIPLGQLGQLVISKMTQRFERNESKKADKDIAKLYFSQPGFQNSHIRVSYHYAKGKILRSSRIFTKIGPMVLIMRLCRWIPLRDP